MSVDQEVERVDSLRPQANRRLLSATLPKTGEMDTWFETVVSAEACGTFTLAVVFVAGSAVVTLKSRKQTVETDTVRMDTSSARGYHGGQSSGLSS